MCFGTSCLQETLEIVKKCRSFLLTLIKLTSNGQQSSETTANVKELIKKLLVDLLSLSSVSFSSMVILCCLQSLASSCFAFMPRFLLRVYRNNRKQR